jgi:trehalose synthase
VDGRDGLLVGPLDTAATGRAMHRLLHEPVLAAAVGAAARERVRSDFLGDRHLKQYVDFFATLVE